MAGHPQRQELKKIPVYPEMAHHHEQVHILAYRIAELHHDGQQKEAHLMLERAI